MTKLLFRSRPKFRYKFSNLGLNRNSGLDEKVQFYTLNTICKRYFYGCDKRSKSFHDTRKCDP